MHGDVHTGAATDHGGIRVHLDGGDVRQELVVREIGAQHDHHVGTLESLGRGTVAE